MNNPIKKQHNVLYRAFDKSKNLLYIGISNSFYDRLRSHLAQAEWVELADHITFEHFYSREEVAEAEKRAIEKELPLFNKTHNPLFQQPKKHWSTITNSFSELDSHHLEIIRKTKLVFEHFWSYREVIMEVKPEPIAVMAFHFVFWETYGTEEPSSPCPSCNKMVEDSFFTEMREEAEVAFAFKDHKKELSFDGVMNEALKLLAVNND